MYEAILVRIDGKPAIQLILCCKIVVTISSIDTFPDRLYIIVLAEAKYSILYVYKKLAYNPPA
jgi:hypothetical protein